MKNIPLQVNIEGQASVVNTDWLAIMATLKKRGLEHDELMNVYFEISSGLRVTTRGLSLAKINPSTELTGITRDVSLSKQEYASIMVA
ncbi:MULTISPECIES: hypothetical protein [Shewanella]|uniref:hypothetical protein n=1 Tax=Shewanella TaxID=22 RepID=UPI00048F0909|nr:MULTISPECIES: hypothetical protein [Shewanella]QLE84382.1 hypothetical protein FLM48_04330 [Shewanella sp. Scap07]